MALVGNLLSANAESIETDASAYAAVLNANTLQRGAGGTLGSFCLSFRGVAAGDCQVGLVTRVAVTPGVDYLAYASVYTPVVNGKSRMEIRWFTSGGTLISTSSGPQMTQATASWNQAAVIGTAPPTAVTANITIRVMATAAAQTWFADRVFLGLVPDVQSGNLFDFATSEMEVDASNWTAVSNSAVAVQPVNVSYWQALKVTSVASGDAVIRSVPAPAVTAGVEYMAYAYVTAGTAGRQTRIEIQWRDAGGATISTATALWDTPSATWARHSVIAKAPAGAVTARVAVVGIATAAAQTWGVDRVVLLATSVVTTAGNLLPYNTADIEQDASGWLVTGGTGTQSTEQAVNGAYSLKLVADGSSDLTLSTVTPVPTPGIGYQFVPVLRRMMTTARILRTRTDWMNADGDVVRSRWQDWTNTYDVWNVFPTGDLAPVDAASVRLSVVILDSGAGDVFYLDRTAFSVGGLTVSAVPAVGGGAAITIRGLSVGGPTWKWTLTREIAGQASAPVRGWDGDLVDQATTADVVVITDYEAPLGVPVQYRVSTLRPVAEGTGNYTYTSDPIVLDAETLDVWLKDPGLPARSVRAVVGTPMPTWTRSARQGVNAVRGRARPIIISDVRSSRTGSLVLVTESPAERDALWWVLESGSTLLLQWPPEWQQQDMYVSVGEVPEAPIVDFAEFTDRTWVLPLTEVDRPVGGIAGSATRTWQTVADSGDSWDAALAPFSSWLDVYTGVEGS